MSSSEACAGDSTGTSARETRPPRPNRSRVKSVAQQQVIAASFDSPTNPVRHWRADSIGPEPDELDSDPTTQLVGPAAAHDDATALLSKALTKLQEALNAKQFNPTGALSLLSNVHAVLVISLLFLESSLIGLNESIDGDLREVLRSLWQKTTEIVKANKFQTGNLESTDQSSAAARLSAALVEQNGQIRLFVDEIDRVWSLLRLHASRALEAVGARPNERPAGAEHTPILKLVSASKATGALRYRWRLARAVTSLGLETSLLKQSALRLLDSLYYCLSTRIFSSIFLLPPLIDSYANPELRILVLSMDCVSSAISLMALMRSSPKPLRDLPRANRQQLKDMWKLMATHLTHQYFNKLARNHKLTQPWSDFLCKSFLLYLHFALLLVAKSDVLIEAAHALSPHLHQVAVRVHEGDLPISAASNMLPQEKFSQSARRWSWNRTSPSPTKDALGSQERGRALSENALSVTSTYKESTTEFSFSRKRMPPECRPPEGSSLDQEVSALPLGCMLTSPRLLRTIQSVIRALPVSDSLHLFTLLCVIEADEYVLLHLDKACKSEKIVERLATLAQEGASIFESRIGSSLFSWDADDVAKTGRETFRRKADSLWLCLSLRFLDLHHDSPTASLEDLCRQRLARQEARWASAIIRVLGDSILQCSVELALPLPLLSPRDVRPETDDLGDVFPFTPRAAPTPPDSYETTSVQTLIALRDLADMQALLTKHSTALGANGSAIVELEEQTQGLTELMSHTREGLTLVEAKAGSSERQLIHLLEGPVARHSNQIKSLMDRFDSTAAEMRRLGGVSATQCAATANQIAELKKQLDAGRALRDDESIQAAIKMEFDKLITSSRDALQNVIGQAQAQMQIFDQRMETFCQGVDASTMALVRKCQADLQEGQRVALSEALTSLRGLSGSVEDLLHRAQNSEDDNNDHAQRHQMLEEMIRVLDLKQTETDKLIQSQNLVDVPSRRGQDELKNLRGMTVDLTNRLKMIEVFCQDTDIRLTERLAQLEADVHPNGQGFTGGSNENRFELAGLEDHFSRCLESLRGECLESIQNLKKKFKHEYLAQLISKTDEMDQQLHALRLMFESSKTKSDLEDLPPRSSKRSVNELREWMDQSIKQVTKAVEGLQWNVADVRRSLDSIIATSASDVDAVQSELLDLRTSREHMEGQLRLKEQRLHALEAAHEEAKEERARMANLLEKLDYGQRELHDRLPSNDGGGTTRRKLSFWGAPFRREGRTQLSPTAVTWRQEEASQRSKSKSPRPRLNSFLSSPSRPRGNTKKHREQPVMEIPVCIRQQQPNLYPPSPTSSINQSVDHGGPISCGTGADGSVQVAPAPKHRLMFTAAMQSNNSV